MKCMTRHPFWIVGFLVLQFSGCATTSSLPPREPMDPAASSTQPPPPSGSTEPGTTVIEEPARPPPPPLPSYTESQTTSHPAVLALLTEATQQETSGDLEVAAAKLERALRIEPRNAVLWHHLASVRLRQGQTQLAVSLAQKSNSFAARDSELVERNQRIIERARGRN